MNLEHEIVVRDLGRLDYQSAWDVQTQTLAAVLAEELGDTLLMVEHEPVLTLGKNPKGAAHILASEVLLKQEGISVVKSDRGGDVTYHGPGQLVVYPIISLNRHRLNIRAYVRLLEDVIIDTCRAFGIHAHRDVCAVGVWVGGQDPDAAGVEIGSRNSTTSQEASCSINPDDKTGRKIAAIGVRVRRWVTLHGLALNVSPNMAHFQHIVPCGLVGRPVTSMAAELGDACPSMDAVKEKMVELFEAKLAILV